MDIYYVITNQNNTIDARKQNIRTVIQGAQERINFMAFGKNTIVFQVELETVVLFPHPPMLSNIDEVSGQRSKTNLIDTTEVVREIKKLAQPHSVFLSLVLLNDVIGWKNLAKNMAEPINGLTSFSVPPFVTLEDMMNVSSLQSRQDTFLHELGHALLGLYHPEDAMYKKECGEIPTIMCVPRAGMITRVIGKRYIETFKIFYSRQVHGSIEK